MYVSISYIYIYAYTYLYEIYAKAIIAARHVFPKRLSLQDMCFKSDYRWHAYFKLIAVHVDFWLKARPLQTSEIAPLQTLLHCKLARSLRSMSTDAEAKAFLLAAMEHVNDPMKRTGNLAREKNAEEWVSGGGDMPVYKIGKCILHEECNSTKRDWWSLDSPERCLGYLNHHLKWSSKHPGIESWDQAQELIDKAMDPEIEEVAAIDWASYVASAKEFAEYNMQWAKPNKKKQAEKNEGVWREAETPPPPPPVKRGRFARPDDDTFGHEIHDDGQVAVVPGLRAAIETEVAMAVRTEMAVAMRDSGGSAPSSSADSRECIVKILGSGRDTYGAAAVVVQEGFYAVPISTFKTMILAVKELEEQMVEDIAFHSNVANAAIDKKHKLTSMRNHLEMVEDNAIRDGNAKGKGKGKGKHR